MRLRERWKWESDLGVRARTGGVPCHNKGFARCPQEFLGWEVGGRM